MKTDDNQKGNIRATPFVTERLRRCSGNTTPLISESLCHLERILSAKEGRLIGCHHLQNYYESIGNRSLESQMKM